MKKVEILGLKKSDWGGFFFGYAEPNEEGQLEMIYGMQSCRGYLQQNFVAMKTKVEELKPFNSIEYTFKRNVDFEKGKTHILIEFPDKETMNYFLGNLEFIHAKEKKAGVRLCKVFQTQEPLILLIEGSYYWKQSVWKIALWTFYLKCTAYRKGAVHENYWTAIEFKKNEESLLSHVKGRTKELFDKSVFGDIKKNTQESRTAAHNYAGFVSICTGKNPPMAKLLGVTHE